MQAKLTFKRGVHTVTELRGDADQITTQELLDMEHGRLGQVHPVYVCHQPQAMSLPSSPIPIPRVYFTSPYYLFKDRIAAEYVARRLQGLRPDWMSNTEAYDEYKELTKDRCPVCNNDTLEHGDYEHEWGQISPDLCRTCGYVQQGAQTDDPTFDQWTFYWLWELQIDPHSR